MMWGIITSSIEESRQGLRGGGLGAINVATVEALECQVRELNIPRKTTLVSKLRYICTVATQQKWLGGDVDGVLNLLGYAPPGDCRRAVYTHSSPWVLRVIYPWYRMRLWERVHLDMMTKHLKGCTVMTNSNWVRDDYIAHGVQATTVYPPCNTVPGSVVVESKDRLRQVMSVGALSFPIKGHEKAAACKSLDVPCLIYGYGTDTPDFGHGSVTKRNVEFSEIDADACKTKVIMSAAHSEDFGIAVVEGVSCGMIPVVPDLYGFKETVPWQELQYRPHDMLHARTVLKDALDGAFDNMQDDIMKNAQQFTKQEFVNRLRTALKY